MRIKLYVDKILYKVYQKGFKQGQRQAEIQNAENKNICLGCKETLKYDYTSTRDSRYCLNCY